MTFILVLVLVTHKINLTTITEWHSIAAVFRGWNGITHSNLRKASIFDILYCGLLEPTEPAAESYQPIEGMTEVGRALSKKVPPWAQEREEVSYGLYVFLPRYEETGRALNTESWNSLRAHTDALFGLIGILAMIIEMQERKPEIVTYVKERASNFVRPVTPILLARLESYQADPPKKFTQVIDQLPLPSDQKALLERWALKKVDLVAPR
jgi:hypothetical protein